MLSNFEVNRKKRLYVDHGLHGIASTVAQLHEIPGSNEKAWKPVQYVSRALTKTEEGYSRVDGESLGILSEWCQSAQTIS